MTDPRSEATGRSGLPISSLLNPINDSESQRHENHDRHTSRQASSSSAASSEPTPPLSSSATEKLQEAPAKKKAKAQAQKKPPTPAQKEKHAKSQDKRRLMERNFHVWTEKTLLWGTKWGLGTRLKQNNRNESGRDRRKQDIFWAEQHLLRLLCFLLGLLQEKGELKVILPELLDRFKPFEDDPYVLTTADVPDWAFEDIWNALPECPPNLGIRDAPTIAAEDEERDYVKV